MTLVVPQTPQYQHGLEPLLKHPTTINSLDSLFPQPVKPTIIAQPFAPGMNPRPSARTTFSAAYEADLHLWCEPDHMRKAYDCLRMALQANWPIPLRARIILEF
jgi:hypothetical protein